MKVIQSMMIRIKHVFERNEFHFSGIKVWTQWVLCKDNVTPLPLCAYFNESKKNEIYFVIMLRYIYVLQFVKCYLVE